MKTIYYLKRAHQLGIARIIYSLWLKGRRKYFAYRYQHNTLKAPDWFTNIDILQNAQQLVPYLEIPKNLYEAADDACLLKQSLLGSIPQITPLSNTVWRHDPIVNHVWPQKFYTDIVITNTEHAHPHYRGPEIKFPWERSRLQHLIVIAQAYRQAITHLDHAQANYYLSTIQDHLDHWIQHNPMLYGVNWLCPMEVGLRSITIITVLGLLHNAPFDQPLLNKIKQTLYQHMLYLEYHWEWSDKPNNHYLADLIGHLYLSALCNDTKRSARTLKKILQQLKHQILPDGTSYEGSTSYHRLDTQMTTLLIHLESKKIIILPIWVYQTHDKMKKFLSDIAPVDHQIITIGDDDSGTILQPLSIIATKKNHVTTYQHFGLTIIKHNAWHITMRHTTNHRYYPTGHYHFDALSITLTLNDIPIFIDPASYLYTSQKTWRNHLRHWYSHNTMHTENDVIPLDHYDLFQLPQTCLSTEPIVRTDHQTLSIQDYAQTEHRRAERTISLNQKTLQCSINDIVTKHGNQSITWQFIGGEGIKLKRYEYDWLIMHYEKPIAYLKTTLPLQASSYIASPAYGHLQVIDRFHATLPASINHATTLITPY